MISIREISYSILKGFLSLAAYRVRALPKHLIRVCTLENSTRICCKVFSMSRLTMVVVLCTL
jgi:hypothetical protein